jgi:hypothetical protein
VTADRYAGAITGWNGSLFYPAKIPDLLGIKDRKYIDHTATHLHRGIGDLMRYAAQVAYVEMADFGEHHMLASADEAGGEQDLGRGVVRARVVHLFARAATQSQ